MSAAYCHLNEVGVLLLMHTIVYESGQSTFWSLVEKDFKDPNWKVRMQAGKKMNLFIWIYFDLLKRNNLFIFL